MPAQGGEVLEGDEVGAFVDKKKNRFLPDTIRAAHKYFPSSPRFKPQPTIEPRGSSYSPSLRSWMSE